MAKKRTGNRILRAVRLELELSQVEFGDEVDLSKTAVSNLENGVFGLGGAAGMRIIERFRPTFERLGYSLEDLLRGYKSKRAA